MSAVQMLPDFQATWHRKLHPDCFVCSKGNLSGLGLEFTVDADGGVVSRFRGDASFSGYRDRIHGGVIASLLDGAMAYCAYVHGLVAVTADLQVRYHEPVRVAELVHVRAWLVDVRGPVYRLGGEIRAGQDVRVSARAKFMTTPELPTARGSASRSGRCRPAAQPVDLLGRE